MPKAVARDLIRVVAFIPYVTENIEACVERAWWWADDIFVATWEDMTLDAESESFPDEDGLFDINNLYRLNEAWLKMSERLSLGEGDYIAILTPDEVLVDSSTLRSAIRENFGKRFSGMRYRMVDPDHYSVFYPPNPVVFLSPYRKQGRYPTLTDHRGPDSTSSIASAHVTDILDYGYATEVGRHRYARLFDDPKINNAPNLDKMEWIRSGKLKGFVGD